MGRSPLGALYRLEEAFRRGMLTSEEFEKHRRVSIGAPFLVVITIIIGIVVVVVVVFVFVFRCKRRARQGRGKERVTGNRLKALKI
jgi:heme/copper-type cytochrome/quinol oxidase subunit 2